MTMSKEQFLLTKLAEECSEVAKAALKAQQFGLNEINPYTGINNLTRLQDELDDLHAAVKMLNECEQSEFLYTRNVPYINSKIYKVEKFLAYSQDLGKVRSG